MAKKEWADDGILGSRVLGTGYWVLGTDYWVLVTGYWLLVTGYWVLITGYCFNEREMAARSLSTDCAI
jgi:hypothetical protein